MANEEHSQWIFTEDELLSTPSILDGITPEDERGRRAKGVNFITQAGIMLKLPQLTIAVASTFFHRFYMRKSMVPEKGGIHHYSIAATALFLATKTEENCRKTKEVVIAVAKVAQKNASLIIDEQSKEYWRWRDSILLYEETMLEELTFDLHLYSPYNVLYRYLQELNIAENKSVRNVAWAFINDSCMTALSLAQISNDVAIAAVYFALKFQAETIPDDDQGNAWWEALNGDQEKIVKAVSILTQFWMENPLSRKELPFIEAGTSGDDLDRTRRASEGSASLASQNGEVKPESDAKRSPDEKTSAEKPALEHATNGDSKEINGAGGRDEREEKMDIDGSKDSTTEKDAEDIKDTTEEKAGVIKDTTENKDTEASKSSPKRKLDEVENGDDHEQSPEHKRAKTEESAHSQESEA